MDWETKHQHHFNENATFLPKTNTDELPCLKVAGVRVFGYVDPADGALCVSVDLDDVDEAITASDDTVPTRIAVEGTTVYDSERPDHGRSVPARDGDMATINRALDDVATVLDVDDDTVHLLAGVIGTYLTGEASTVADAVDINWAGDAHVDDTGRPIVGHGAEEDD